MENKKVVFTWAFATQYIRSAALQPGKRFEHLLRALEVVAGVVPALGTALIWPYRQGKIPWKVLYAGANGKSMYRWLSARLRVSLEEMMGILQHDCTTLTDMPAPLLMHLQPSDLSQSGLWITWPSDPLSVVSAPQEMEHMRYHLEALLEVEQKENLYFPGTFQPLDQQVIKALTHGDTQAFPPLLSLARVMGKADLTYWGRVRGDDLEVAWSVGAEKSGFGFELPLGEGIGGRAASLGEIQEVLDYRNSPYRYPDVREIVDSERVRSGLVIPVHTATSQTGGVLYLTRRSISPFSLADKLLMLRLVQTIEPLSEKKYEASFFVPQAGPYTRQKSAWRDIMLHANHLAQVEQWIAEIIAGPAIVVDAQDVPYRPSHTELLNRLLLTRENTLHVIPLAHSASSHADRLYLWPSISLPPVDWPDFLFDAAMACNVVIARMEQARDQVRYQQEQWLRSIIENRAPDYLGREGYRLGLLAEYGEVWVIAWLPAVTQKLKELRLKTSVENVILEKMQSPLLFLEKEHLGIILIRGRPQHKPAEVRDELLNAIGPHPLWIIYGAVYHSLPELKTALTQAITLAQKARNEDRERYVLNIHTFGLTGLLENPRLLPDLEEFAQRVLEPLIEYDAQSHAELTRTFILTCTLGSLQAVAGHLSIHINTVRYRIQQAKRLLGKEVLSPEEDTALKLAAFIWQYRHRSER